MNRPTDEPQASQTLIQSASVPWMVGPSFLLLAGWFVLASPPASIPIDRQPLVERNRIVPGARRLPMGEPPSIMNGGYTHACNECHRLFDSPPVERRVLLQHTEIAFNHGMNDRCFNCHDRRNRERLVLRDGSLLGFDQVPRLCSQCHGTVYRDWQLGTHGKTMGSWIAASGSQSRLNCNDCHDPHSPAYKPIEPLPGPNTLRMGDQSEMSPGHQRHIPLRRWSLPEGDAVDSHPASAEGQQQSESKERAP